MPEKVIIGIEREPKYFEIACRRIEQAQVQSDMFVSSGPAALRDVYDQTSIDYQMVEQ